MRKTWSKVAGFEDGRMDVCMPRTASYLGKLEKGKKIDSLLENAKGMEFYKHLNFSQI